MATSPFGERLTKSGAIIIGPNQLALLQGLLDRPEATAFAVYDWVASARPYCRATRWVLYKSIRRMNPAWVHRFRVGRHVRVSLRPRGRAIVMRTIPAQVHGHGLYVRTTWRGR